MSTGDEVSFFVKVDGQSYSRHRDPSGVYKVQVKSDQTIRHCAANAAQVARDCVPFLDENPNNFTLRTFLENGEEIVVPTSLHTTGDGLLIGRATQYPDSVTLQ